MELVEAGIFGDVEEDGRSSVDEATGGDGAVLRILDGRIDAAGAHAGLSAGRGLLNFAGLWILSYPERNCAEARK